MLKSNELRIGNSILYAGKEIIVEGILCNTICHSKGQYDQNTEPAYEPFKGIKLTKELILNLGFTKVNLENNKSYLSPKFNDSTQIVIYFNRYGVAKFSINTHLSIEIPYVHTLQNLFFSLSGGTELIFTNNA